MKPVYTLIHIPLSQAFLCINCDSIGTNGKCCSACSSSVVISLSNLLNNALPLVSYEVRKKDNVSV